jgi:hypothetical protein
LLGPLLVAEPAPLLPLAFPARHAQLVLLRQLAEAARRRQSTAGSTRQQADKLWEEKHWEENGSRLLRQEAPELTGLEHSDLVCQGAFPETSNLAD